MPSAHFMMPRVYFLGSEGVFSSTVLQVLLSAGCRIVKVGLADTGVSNGRADVAEAAGGRGIPVQNLNTLGGIAWAWGIPLQRIAGAPRLRYPLCADSTFFDVILAACFPFRVPEWLLRFPRYGCLNLHPSLLPAYRGPAPLFWQLRDGVSRGGITLHVMTDKLDAGDIVAQESLRLSPGIRAAEANRQLAESGGRLAVKALGALASGRLRRRPQEEREASYFPWPKESDFRLYTEWPAERAFRFVRGTAEWGLAYPLTCGAHHFSVTRALGFSPEGHLGKAWEWQRAELWFQFNPGILQTVAIQLR